MYFCIHVRSSEDNYQFRTIIRKTLCKVWVKKKAHVERLAISKKSTIFVLSSWNVMKMISSWDDYFHQVSWGLDKKYGFFTNGQFLNVSHFLTRLYNIFGVLKTSITTKFWQNFNKASTALGSHKNRLDFLKCWTKALNPNRRNKDLKFFWCEFGSKLKNLAWTS